MYSITCL